MLPGSTVAVLAFVGVLTAPERRNEGKETIDQVIHPWAVSIVDTPTPPTGSRRIDVSRWEDLLRAAELLGRPILRLHGGEGGSEGRLFYVADGPQSYVFGFNPTSLNVSRSGAFAPRAPVVAPLTSLEEEVAEPAPSPLDLPGQPAPEARETPPIPPPVVPDPADALLGPEMPGEALDTALPSATIVERRIREMIHELLDEFRQLPPSSDRLERGTEHIQRAIDMLHLGRYGVAQIELNKAARLLKEDPKS